MRAVHVGPLHGRFRPLDNPIAFTPPLTRWLSTARLHATTAGLMLYPYATTYFLLATATPHD